MQRLYLILLGLTLLVAGCNANSDAVRVLETENTSLRATVAAYEGAGPKLTEQARPTAQKVASMQAELGTLRAQNKDLIAKLNDRASLSSTVQVPPPNVADSGTPGMAGTQAANAPTGFAILEVAMAKAVDTNSGCAVTKVNTFAVSDARIWVVADVRNYKSGTNFTSKWSGGDLNKEFSFAVSSGGKRTCINFYIEPATLGLKAGTYTVTISATGVSSDPVQFTLQ
jgi:hypothetical protein